TVTPNTLRKSAWISALAAALVLFAACKDLKTPAQQALDSVTAAVESVTDVASIYAPQDLAAVQNALTGLQQAFGLKEYQKVIDGVPQLKAQVDALNGAIASRKAELGSTWNTLTAGLPGVVDAIKGRMDILAQAKKLPAGMTPEMLAGAQQGLADMTGAWGAATAAANADNLVEAVAQGNRVKSLAAQVMTSLGMAVPPALAN
ncbi:MAG: hypothetical protein MUC67_11180, partial [Acidobacteria bacterium]|nr:hypothetical protein [Acidobacteriota bacterium]